MNYDFPGNFSIRVKATTKDGEIFVNYYYRSARNAEELRTEVDTLVADFTDRGYDEVETVIEEGNNLFGWEF